MRKICVDIDNVIAQTDSVIRAIIQRHSVERANLEYEDVVCFDYWRCRDSAGRKLHKSEWPSIHERFSRDHIDEILPVESAAEALAKISSRFEVILVTSRLDVVRKNTEDWLKQHKFHYSELLYSRHGHKHERAEKFEFAVEDDREQAYAFALSGVKAMLFAHPWNVIGPESPLIRASTWHDIADLMLK